MRRRSTDDAARSDEAAALLGQRLSNAETVEVLADSDVSFEDFILMISENPLLVVFALLLPSAIVYLFVWWLLPPHVHERNPQLSAALPVVCVAVIIVSVGWIIDPDIYSWLSMPARVFRAIRRTGYPGKARSVYARCTP